MKTISLTKGWTLDIKDRSFQVDLPCLQLLTLIENGILPDLNDCKEDKEYFAWSDEFFTFSKDLTADSELLGKNRVELYFERLDTLCTVKVNGTEVGKADNIHIPYTFDIKSALKEGENLIEVCFRPIRDYIAEKQQELKIPANFNGTPGHPHIRKCGCHFGWDFGPELNAQGIGGDCQLRYGDNADIAFLSVRQSVAKQEGKVELSCEMGEGRLGEITYRFLSPENTLIEEKTLPAKKNSTVFYLDNPQLWWCAGLGQQPLYTLEAAHTVDGEIVSLTKKRIGFRTIILDTSADEYGNNFQFFVNGKGIFAKGGNFIPYDAFYTRTTPEKLRSLLTECKASGMNMIRVWGGGFYESDDFYDIADELGILLWQDCAFACCAYPFMKKDFLDNIAREIEYNVRRLRHRASLCLWCGNNEIESMSMAWIARKDFIDSTGKYFYEILPEQIKELDGVTPYHACSPSSGKYMNLPNSDNAGDTHIWNVWHGYQYKEYFNRRYTRFCSEFGMQSYPNKGVTPHQKCDMGEERLAYYLSGIYTLPEDMKSKIYLTQLIQSHAMKQAVEHFRSHSHRCHGALFWQLNDLWPSASWAGFDCYGGKKALMYHAKTFNAPLLLTAEKSKGRINVYVCNDTPSTFEGTAQVILASPDKGEKVLSAVEVTAAALSSKRLTCFPAIRAEGKILILRLLDSQLNPVGENRLTFNKEKNLSFTDPVLSLSVRQTQAGSEITVSAVNYARNVFICAGNAKLSDNFFDLSAGESITVTSDEKLTKEDIEVYSLYEILSGRSSIEDTKAHLTEFFRPMALTNRISRYFDK